MESFSPDTAPPAVDSRRRALIVVDMSVEQVAGIHYNKKSLISNSKLLCQNANKFFDLILDSRLWLRSPEESSLAWVYPETAKTLFVADSDGASLIPELRSFQIRFVKKNNYSCFANSKLLSILRDTQTDEVYVCGINTDYCVFLTALDSFQHKILTYVVEDAVTSVCGKTAHVEGLRNLKKHLGDQVLVTTKDCIEG
jgi:nicotinamidase-related amidase